MPESAAPVMAAMTPFEKNAWTEILEARWGVHYSESRLHQLQSSLRRRMKAVGLNAFPAYQRFLSASPGEWQALKEEVLNRETCFFRHRPSYVSLARVLAGIAAARNRTGGRRVWLWSAGCATGQEAYSMAMTALDCPAMAALKPRVVGSDLSGAAIETARLGLYRARSMDGVSAQQRSRYFVRRAGSGVQEEYEAGTALRSTVEFTEANLCDPASFGTQTYDVIFCQNVLIYFREDRRKPIAESLAARLSRGGCLFLAPGEVITSRIGVAERVPFPDALCYQRAETDQESGERPQ